MQWALYHFVMAFRYEFLMDVPADMLDIDYLIDQIVKSATLDATGQPIKDAFGKPLTLETVSAETYAACEERVLKDFLLRIAKALIDRRQIKNQPEVREISSPFPLMGAAPGGAVAVAGGLVAAHALMLGVQPALPEDKFLKAWVARTTTWLEALRRDRVVWLHPVDDLKMVGDYRTRGARIRAVNLREIRLDVPASRPRFEFTLRFIHSGVSLIYDTSEDGTGFDYFYFTKGPNDDSISWNFRCVWDPGERKVTFTPDKTVEDSMILALMKAKDLQLKPYQPALYSPLAVKLDYTLSSDPEAFPAISALNFGLQIEHTGDPPVAAPRG